MPSAALSPLVPSNTGARGSDTVQRLSMGWVDQNPKIAHDLAPADPVSLHSALGPRSLPPWASGHAVSPAWVREAPALCVFFIGIHTSGSTAIPQT